MPGQLRSRLNEQEVRNRLAGVAGTVCGKGRFRLPFRLVRLDVVLDDVDPWAFVLDPATDAPLADRRWMLWDDPKDGSRFAALGVALHYDGGSPSNPDARIRLAGSLLESHPPIESLGNPAGFEQLPTYVGSFSFDSADADDAERLFDGWNAPLGCLIWLPEVLVAYMHGRVTATVFAKLPAYQDEEAAQANARSDAEAALAELCARAEHVDACLARYATAWPSSSSSPEPQVPERSATAGPSAAQFVDDAQQREDWLTRAQLARDTVAGGEAQKLVLARAAELTSRDGRPFDVLATAVNLRQQQPGCVTYAIHQPDGSALVGATPETLLRLGGRVAQSVALAGTSRVADDTLATRDKDLHEHRLVVDAIVEALEPFSTTVEADETPRVVRFTDVQHLETAIHAWLPRETTAFNLLHHLHPTPAVNGLPAEFARDWLRRHGGLNRGWYAGPIGWVNPLGDGTWMVALRCALLRGTRAWAFAGAGIVAASEPEAEWTETTWKMQAVTTALRTEPLRLDAAGRAVESTATGEAKET